MVSFVRISVLAWADILAGYALWVMVTYLTNVWNLSFTHAAAIVNFFTGAASIMPIGMAFLVDAFVGDYFMLLLSSFAFSVGLSFLAMSMPPVLSETVGNCSAYQQDCIGNTQKVLFYTGLALIVVGLSGHMTSLESFLNLQMQPDDQNDPQRQQNEPDFMDPLRIVGALAALVFMITGGIALPYIKPWSVRFGIPAICTIVATLLFLSGSRLYRRDRRQGSSLTSLFKNIIRIIPMWVTFLMCGVVSSIGSTYFLEQANNMNRKVGHLILPLPILKLFHDGAKNFAASLIKENWGRRASTIGFVFAMIFSTLCCITAAKVETRRLDVIKGHGLLDKPDEKIPMTIFWLLPQFLLLGALDGLFAKSIDRFFNDNVPQSRYLKKFGNGVTGAGIMGSVLTVYIAGKVSERGGKPSWFQDTLNRSRLDKYYWLLSVLTSINLVLFILVAIWYPYQGLESGGDGEAQGNAQENGEAQGNGETEVPENPENEDNANFFCCC